MTRPVGNGKAGAAGVAVNRPPPKSGAAGGSDAARRAVGILIALAVAGLIAALLWGLWGAALDTTPTTRIDVLHLVGMSATQAALTTLLSLSAGVALAWALDRLRFFGRELVTGLFAAALVTPAIVVAAGVLAVWGRSGMVNAALAPFGLSWGGSIFGLGGILLAHTVLNGAFAARVLLGRLEAVPRQRLKAGQSLGLSAWQRFSVIDWPALAGGLPGLAAIVFLLAFTSFPIVLLLGGGPANQTLEVAIYTAVRLDFDLRTAVTLALVQLSICAVIVLAATGFSPGAARAGAVAPFGWRDGRGARALQVAVLGLGLMGFAMPLLAVLWDGLLPQAVAALLSRQSFWPALTTSLGVGAASAILALMVALGLTMARTAATGWLRTLLALPVFAYLAVPGVVLSFGFFVLVREIGLGTRAGAPVVLVLGNALLALPFAFATLSPKLADIAARYGRLSRSLDLSGWRRWTDVEWPLLGREIGIVLAIAFCFSLGDLGIIALFGTESFSTLPWLMMRALGAYRTADAAVIAAMLLLICLLAFAVLPRLIERLADARA